MSRPIDYSKWDRIEDSDDEEGQELEQQERGPPRVTKFDAPMSVTIGGGGGGGAGANSEAGVTPSAGLAAPSSAPAAPPKASDAAGVTRPGPSSSSSSKVEDVAENGDELEAYSWRQGKQEAVLMVWCPGETRAKDVDIAYDKESRLLRVTAGGTTLLEGELANPVKVDEDTGLDWELVGGAAGGARRAVRVSLQKETPRADMVHWWSRALTGDREIDTTKIQGRKHNFQQAWEEAQALFQESIRKRAEQGPVEIP